MISSNVHVVAVDTVNGEVRGSKQRVVSPGTDSMACELEILFNCAIIYLSV